MARDTVTHDQRGDRSLQTRAESAGRDIGRHGRPLRATAAGTVHPRALMLDQPNRDPRELLHLGTHRLPDRHALCLGEQVPATARVRPMLDDLIRRRRRQQTPATPPMPILAALFAP